MMPLFNSFEFLVLSDNDDEAMMIRSLTDHSITIVSKLISVRSNSLFTEGSQSVRRPSSHLVDLVVRWFEGLFRIWKSPRRDNVLRMMAPGIKISKG